MAGFDGGGVDFLNLFPGMGGAIPQQPQVVPGRPAIPMMGSLSPRMPPPMLSVPGTESTAFPTLGASLQGAQFGTNPLATAGSVGGNVANSPVAQAAQAAQAANGGGGGAGAGDKFMNALRGVQAPKPPEVQTVRTPPPPQATPIKGGEFANMMTSLGISPQEFVRMTQLKLR